ncbi:MAG: hypothetical protein HKL91_02195 [Candidatus Eremiobacteraeota bacterium]|uniref:Uncharacterized protein n=1 Tax=mine drainage metagenome TaxID=410659 RepID=E6PCQ5_9ZZZZ|nr:hypothetical protein [Candidatus Eremiobacteraeota bacterium]
MALRDRLRRAIALAIVTSQVALLAASTSFVSVRSVRAAGSVVCGTPGKDGSPGTLNGVYNTYYIPPAGTIAAGSTTLSLGTIDTANGGASTAVAKGDELLIIQMQDGSFNAVNGPTYGSGTGSIGVAGNDGTGYTSLGNAGLYEYVKVTAVTGSTVTIVSTGAGGGLLNSYTNASATLTSGRKTYQIIRVPQYLTATLSSNFAGAPWDGSTGGVAALDLASTLNLGGATIYATADGFRGGGKTVQTKSPSGWSTSDYMESSTTLSPPADGSKGEGVMGSPNYVFDYTNFSNPSAPAGPQITSSGADGYPGGDQARGAPGNAGGGGTDDDPLANDQNTGGGGGGNGGAGGNGGYPWTPTYSVNTAEYDQYPYSSGTKTYSASNFHDIGGRGGSAIAPVSIAPTRAFLGGGGGAGANNNNSDNNAYNNYGSSGGPGGGIVLLRIAQTSGSTATIQADGYPGLAPANDGGGGGGAGGTIIVTSPSTFSGITVAANGAAGTTANAAPTTYSQQHGPGGGGGGGIVMSSSPVSAAASGGSSGTTTTNATSYGATAGTAGVTLTVSANQIPGISSGAECYNPTASPLLVGPVNTQATGTTASYGANASGSFDGVVPTTNSNDFTARGFAPPTGVSLTNSSTTPGSPIGNTFQYSASPPSIAIPNALYYNSPDGNFHDITITAQAPLGWTVQLCSDNGTGTPGSGTGGNGADCTINVTYGTSPYTSCMNGFGFGSSWDQIGQAAGNTAVAIYCMDPNALPPVNAGSGNPIANDPNGDPYDVVWAVYTPPLGTNITAFTRYDASLFAVDDGTSGTTYSNATHNELYAGFVPLTKSVTVVSNGCPAGVAPAYNVLGVCPTGILRYSIDYRNIVAGASSETGLVNDTPDPLLPTSAGSLVITENGTLSSASQTSIPNWGAFSNGLLSVLGAGVSNASCGSGTSLCGDSTAGTTFTGNTIGSKTFTAQIGGTAFQLFPFGVTGKTNQGTITFAVQAK